MVNNSSYLKKLGGALIANGYDIVPITKNKKYPAGHENMDWKSRDYNSEFQRLIETNPEDGVGVKTGQIRALDIDSESKALVDSFIHDVYKRYGKVPVRWGKAPKAMLIYRADKPTKKLASKAYKDEFNSTHRLEIMGEGQQVVTYATHPDTGKDYTWSDGIGIAGIKLEDLPIIPEDDLLDLIQLFQSLVPEHWVAQGDEDKDISEINTSTEIMDNYRPTLSITDQEVQETLDVLDPDMPYPEWVVVGMGLYHQYSGSNTGYDLYVNWSMQGIKYLEDDCAKKMPAKWQSFKENLSRVTPITFATVIKMANEARSQPLSIEDLALAPKQVETNDGITPDGKFVDFVSEFNEIRMPRWRIENFFEEDTVGLIFGDYGSYKSFIALDAALHIATGKDWHGNKVNKGAVFLIEGEGNASLARRGRAWKEYHGLTHMENNIYRTKAAVPILQKDEIVKVYHEAKAICQSRQQHPGLVVIDTLARNFGVGDENSNTDMSRFIANIDILKRVFRCPILIIHHSSKSNKNNARGASALEGACDFIYRVEKPVERQAVMTCMKMKDAPIMPDMYFEAEQIHFPSMEGPETNSLVMVPTEKQIEVTEPLKGKQLQIMNLVRELAGPDGITDRSQLVEQALEEGVYTTSGAIRKTLLRLQEKGCINVNDDQVQELANEW